MAIALADVSLELNQSERLAAAVHKLSSFYLSHPGQPTPYHEDWAKIASLVYFLPLNYLRARAVVDYGQEVGFFSELGELVDFGSGLGPISLALQDGQVFLSQQTFIEKSDQAQRLQEQWTQPFIKQSLSSQPGSLLPMITDLGADIDPARSDHGKSETSTAPILRSPNLDGGQLNQQSLLSFSYSWAELESLPRGYQQAEALLLIEPSTSKNSRRLQAKRSQLIKEGFSIWAPCTHHQDCPLLDGVHRDWCHHRIAVQMPPWFSAMERHLPMQNRTLTFSYLLVRKKSPPQELLGSSRVIGDWQKEKGKSKQLICRGPQREFLSVLKRSKLPITHQRGDLLRLTAEDPSSGNEVRPHRIENWRSSSQES